ncbi:GNAT family N-acetyltransferase [Insolitispirillum peregrinum]|uniref:Ribosomal protein S18 acetylase RimI n=1 Tax=Insolitispirillum peregrinum TaxID=80876 RepID=A0A1N7LDE9_9PROT|nr:GNAT family N-acetyltransferase [Insolitispirillum peregrinum]SIS71849.1 Ribosomal protein S18 acetylase RimI [Insolitispirillum peregrinum]
MSVMAGHLSGKGKAFGFPSPARPAERGAILRIAGWRLRPATRKDEGFLRTLYASLRAEELRPSGWSDQARADFCTSQFDLQHADWTRRYPLAQFLVIMDGERRIGRLYVDLSSSVVRLIDIGLLPDWQGKGIGSAVLRALQERAQAVGGQVGLSVLDDNLRALALYQRAGFVVSGQTGMHWQMVWQPAPLGA